MRSTRHHKIKTVTKRGLEGDIQEIEIDLTTLLHPAPSTISNADLLVTEARIAAEAGEDETSIENPHTPAHDGVLDIAEERLDDEDLTPAW